MSTSNLPRGCDTSMWFHQCLHQKGKECVCDLVHARLICSHITSAQAHPRSPKLHLFLSQTPLLASIQLHLTLSSPLHPYLTPSSPGSLTHMYLCICTWSVTCLLTTHQSRGQWHQDHSSSCWHTAVCSLHSLSCSVH